MHERRPSRAWILEPGSPLDSRLSRASSVTFNQSLDFSVLSSVE